MSGTDGVSWTAFDPAALAVRDRYKLLIGAVVPRPIAWVSTAGADGLLNLAPFSFFNGVGSDPMTLVFCPANDESGGEKDTLRNAKPREEGGTGEFVVNIVSGSQARAMSVTAEGLSYGESEFALAGLEAVDSVRVRPPRVGGAPVAYECETMQVVRTNPGVPGGGNLVIGRVVMVHVREDLHDGACHIDPETLDATGRMAGLGYCTTRDRFELPWGRRALEP